MKVVLVTLLLFVFCLFLSSSAQHQFVNNLYVPGNLFLTSDTIEFKAADAPESLQMSPILIALARFAKIIYTGQREFEFEVPDTLITHEHKRDN